MLNFKFECEDEWTYIHHDRLPTYLGMRETPTTHVIDDEKTTLLRARNLMGATGT